MSTMTPTAPAVTVNVPGMNAATAEALKVTQGRVIKSEWLKFRTLRSSWVLLILGIGALAGTGIALSWSTIADWSHMHPHELDHLNPLADSLVGFQLAQLFVGVLGIILIAGEYSTGMIRSSLGAVPKRLPVLWAKTLVVAVLTFVTMLPASLIAFFASQKILSGKHIQTAWTAPHVPRSVIGVALYLTVVAILGVGLGALIRNIAGAIATFVGVMLILPGIASSLSQVWADRINRFLPSTAGQSLLSFGSETREMMPWNGFGLFTIYAVGTVIAAAVVLKRRDA
jgi:ABC-2 type transport system permease protein